MYNVNHNLNSCLTFLIPCSCNVNILLKRYLCSQAFINVARGLAHVLRSMVSQRPLPLSVSSIVQYITEWTLEEVMAISTMTASSLQDVFKHTMRFDRRWEKILNPEDLPEELKKVQVSLRVVKAS